MNSDFYSNQNSIFIGEMDNAIIVANNFRINGINPPLQPYRYGLYIENSTGYTIEENFFEEKESLCTSIGMYISNSGKDPNEVYKNDFKNLDYGIVAYGINRDEEGAGLCLKCNNFETCTNDIHVIPENDGYGNWLQGREQGIASMQGTNSPGSNTSPAGNTFTKLEDIYNTFNYFNHQDCNKIYYYHHQNNNTNLKIVPEPTSSLDWFEPLDVLYTEFNSPEEACPSNLGGGSINLSLEKNLISFENELLVTYSDSIQALKDGGDTYALNLNVYTSTPDESYQIRQQLLDESPYLSDTVMKSAILKENVFPNAMIRDVLVANPQSAKSSEILIEVNERMDPMPDEMFEEILEGRTYKGNLELMQDKLAGHQTEKYSSLRKLESYYKQDTLDSQGSQDSLINLWECETDPSARYRLAFLYLHKGDSLNCFSTLNSIPQLNELTPDEIVEFEEYSELISLFWPLRAGIMNMDSISAGQLFALAGSKSIPGTLARNILVASGLTEYHEPIYLSTELKSSLVIPEKERNYLNVNQRLKIFPNPAQDYFILSYDLSGLQGNFGVDIINSEGNTLIYQKLSGTQNQIVISTVSLPSSPYTIRLITESSCIETVKFIILK